MEDEKFDFCGSCTDCCRNFGEKGFPLYPKEFRRYKELAEARGLKFSHTLCADISDSKTSVNIVEEYRIITRPCVFLDSGCTIYEDRPLICRAYPYHITDTLGFGTCPNIDRFKGQAKFDLIDDPQMKAAQSCLDIGKENARRLMELHHSGRIALGPAIPNAKFVDIDVFLKQWDNQ